MVQRYARKESTRRTCTLHTVQTGCTNDDVRTPLTTTNAWWTRRTQNCRSARVYADGGGAANGMGTFTAGTDGIGGKATLGPTDGTTAAGIGGRVSLGSTDEGTAGIGGSATCGGTVTLGAAGMGGNVTCGTVTLGAGGMGGSVTCGTVTAGTAGMGGSAACGMVGTAGRPGTAAAAAAGAAAAAVVSAKWRAAWQVSRLVMRSAQVTTMARKFAAETMLC